MGEDFFRARGMELGVGFMNQRSVSFSRMKEVFRSQVMYLPQFCEVLGIRIYERILGNPKKAT